MVRLGHEVHLLCQDRDARALPWVDAVGAWDDGSLRVETLREPVRCTVYTPPIGRVLPVYVADRYEGFDAKPFERPDRRRARPLPRLQRRGGARRRRARARPEAALANHLVMGPVVLARAGLRYAVKIHGSALEYTVKPHRERFLPLAREGLESAAGVLVGSRHTAESLWEAMADPSLPERTRLGPPGVDVHEFRPREAATRRALGLRALADRLEGAPAAGWGGDEGAAAALRCARPRARPDRLLRREADRVEGRRPPPGRLAARRRRRAGRATVRRRLRRVPRRAAPPAGGDRRAGPRGRARGRPARPCARGRAEGELAYLAAFLDALEGDDRERWLAAAPEAAARVHFTGRLEHGDLPDLLPACEAQVVPEHVSRGVRHGRGRGRGVRSAPALGVPLGPRRGDGRAPARRSTRTCARCSSSSAARGRSSRSRRSWWRGSQLDDARRARASAALSELARGRYGWESVAEGVIAASAGELDGLPRPTAPPSEPF